MKKLLIILGSLLALVVIGLFIASFFLGSIVTKGVNTYGPRITGTPVTLESASISPFSGTGTLNNLMVGNPPGWTSDKAFSFKKVHVNVVPSSVTSEHIQVNEVVIDAPEFVYETRLVTSNIQQLLANIEKNTGGGGSMQPADQPKTDDGKPLKISVKSFRLENAKVTVGVGPSSIVVPMPPVVLTDLGTNEGGLTSAELAKRVVTVILRDIAKVAITHAANSGAAAELKDAASAAIKKAGDDLKKSIGGAGEKQQ